MQQYFEYYNEKLRNLSQQTRQVEIPGYGHSLKTIGCLLMKLRVFFFLFSFKNYYS
jgi:hypothetical protein